MTRALADRITSDAPDSHVVYLLSDAAGDVVYIGRSGNVRGRLRDHASTSDWWPEVADGWWYPCDDVVAARLLERECIARYQPRHNVNDAVEVPSARVPLPESAVESLRALYSAAAGEPRHSEAARRLNGYVWLLRQNGWPLSSIGEPLGHTREAVRLRERQGGPVGGLPPVPPFRRPEKPPKPVKKRLHVREDVAERLRELHALARQVNGATPADDPRRDASVELTEALAQLVIQGVSQYELARVLGVHQSAVRFRLARHGYIGPIPGAPARYVGQPTWHRKAEQCRRGHPLSGENVRLVNGDPTRRVCRACERLRVAAYRARREALAGAA